MDVVGHDLKNRDGDVCVECFHFVYALLCDVPQIGIIHFFVGYCAEIGFSVGRANRDEKGPRVVIVPMCPCGVRPVIVLK